MAKQYLMQANARDGAGKGIARALRREQHRLSFTAMKEPVPIPLDQNSANVEYNRGHMLSTLCDLDVAGEKHLVLARDVQLHPVTDMVEHVDFLRVTAKTKIAVSIPVELVNEDASPGMKQGGILNVVRFEVELVCSATKIPDLIEVDLTGKEMGDSVRISDAKLPEGTSPVIDDRDFAIATIDKPKTAERKMPKPLRTRKALKPLRLATMPLRGSG